MYHQLERSGDQDCCESVVKVMFSIFSLEHDCSLKTTAFFCLTRMHTRVWGILEGYVGDVWEICGGNLNELWRKFGGN